MVRPGESRREFFLVDFAMRGEGVKFPEECSNICGRQGPAGGATGTEVIQNVDRGAEPYAADERVSRYFLFPNPKLRFHLSRL